MNIDQPQAQQPAPQQQQGAQAQVQINQIPGRPKEHFPFLIYLASPVLFNSYGENEPLHIV